jgi:hypothetical protein
MRVYKFLSCKYGLKVIRERRLKISEVRSLNDPFDLLPFDMSDPELRSALLKSKEEMGRTRGLICFSKYWHNPVLWAHYADSHKGICLGFDLPDDSAQAIEYVSTPIRFSVLNEATANRLVFTKYKHWEYLLLESSILEFLKHQRRQFPFLRHAEDIRFLFRKDDLRQVSCGTGADFPDRVRKLR